MSSQATEPEAEVDIELDDGPIGHTSIHSVSDKASTDGTGTDNSAPGGNTYNMHSSRSAEFLQFAHRTAYVKSSKFVKEVKTECLDQFEMTECLEYFRKNWVNFVHVPYLPAFHRPGWLLRYIVGPHNWDLFESFYYDILAGITVGMTLIPQGLSYASLANLPPINGLYTAILPFATYVLFGSSMQLGVGPVAVISLLTGQLIEKYGIDYVNDPQAAVDFASEAAIGVGTIMTVMAVLNLGNFIRFISHPVMSGFTTAAACLIGLSQLKSAFGFGNPDVPQTGQEHYHFNFQVMQWYLNNWDSKYPEGDPNAGYLYRNKYAAQICFGLYVPLIIVVVIKNNFKPTAEQKKTVWFNVWNVCASLMPFFAIVIGAHVGWQIKFNNAYGDNFYSNNLNLVGVVPSGLNFIAAPKMNYNFGQLLADVFPLTLIAFMESYSVAHRIATMKNQLHLLNASQEMWANGVSNFMSGISSGYPIAGSFSRSSLNAAVGCRTPLSKLTTMLLVVIALEFFTKAFEFIPLAALAAVIWSSIFNLINVSEFWHSWCHSKKDFMVAMATFITVFVFNTEIGLGVGLLVSFLFFLSDTAFSSENGPKVVHIGDKYQEAGILFIKLQNDLSFLTVGRLNDMFTNMILLKSTTSDLADAPDAEKQFYAISNAFDRVLTPSADKGVDKLPSAIIIDFHFCRVIDLDAMVTMDDMFKIARQKKVKVVIVNVSVVLGKQLTKFGFQNDHSDTTVDLEKFLRLARNIPRRGDEEKMLEAIDMKGSKSAECLNLMETQDLEQESERYGVEMTMQRDLFESTLPSRGSSRQVIKLIN